MKRQNPPGVPEMRKEQRRTPREKIIPAGFGIICRKKFPPGRTQKERARDSLVVNLMDMSEGGAQLQSSQRLPLQGSYDMMLQHPSQKKWKAARGKIIWLKPNAGNPGFFLFGVEFQKKAPARGYTLKGPEPGERSLLPGDIEFLLNTTLFTAIPQESICPLLNSLVLKTCKAGERLITQGDKAESIYVIRSGSCVVVLEREGALEPVARLRPGDIVGEMAVLTGERRVTHVDAETDMELWEIRRKAFDGLSRKYPDLRIFLTEIVTQRLESSKVSAFRKIGKYFIHQVIGQGAWSIVYKGVHHTLNLPVAVKMLKHNMTMDEDFLERFRNEAKTIARMNHPNIVKIYDIEELYRTLFIVMEYLEGMSLEDQLAHMPRPSLTKALDIILQVSAGLAYAHQKGVIHQDIKPGNIFIDTDDRVKIVDFGLACAPGNRDFDLPGTLYYMSPEQIQGNPVDERTDIYSLGIMAYELVTGMRPFPEEDLGRLMEMHLREDAPDPRALVSPLPDVIVRFLMKSVRRDPGARYGTVSELIDDLTPLSDELGLTCGLPTHAKKKMMSVFVFYEDEHQLMLNQLIDDLNRKVTEAGASVRVARVEDV